MGKWIKITACTIECGNGRGGRKRRTNQNVHYKVLDSSYALSDKDLLEHLLYVDKFFLTSKDSKIVRIHDLNPFHQEVRKLTRSLRFHKSEYKFNLNRFNNRRKRKFSFAPIIEQRLRRHFEQKMRLLIERDKLLNKNILK